MKYGVAGCGVDIISKRSNHMDLYDVGNVLDVELPAGNSPAQLAKAASRLFIDDDFAVLNADKNGRPSIPPSLLAHTCILHAEAHVSDEEAIVRTAFDLRSFLVILALCCFKGN